MRLIRPAELGIGVLFELIRDAVVVADVATSRICLWNTAATAMFGYTPADAIGLPLEVLVPDEHREAHHAGLATYLTSGHGALIDSGDVVTVPAVCRDGRRITVELRLSPLSGPPGTSYVMAVIRDVTDRAALAAGLAAANASLEIALRTEQDVSAHYARLIELKDDFVAMLSHDLASPLTSIKGNASLLRRSWDRLNPGQRSNALEGIERATDRMSALIGDLLDAARLDAGAVPYDRGEVDIAAALRRVAAEVDPTGSRVVLRPSVDTAIAMADQARHDQIAVNLLTNALKFSPAASEVEVAVSTTAEDVVVEIRDRGPGIAEADRDRLFQRFQRITAHDGTAQGTGLGLYITRRLVEDQGGRIEMAANPGGGAVFRYTLPRAVSPTGARA
ncbi:MAG TPA: ATP-binding protein [Mycobacteriales bacterium]|nr:ATP-binding protein [Mycobacteriales bacterium]